VELVRVLGVVVADCVVVRGIPDSGWHGGMQTAGGEPAKSVRN